MPAAKALVQAKRICARATGVFRTDRDVLQTACALLDLRSQLNDEPDESRLYEASRLERKFTGLFHKRLTASPDSVHTACIFKKHKLSRIEREIMLTLALSATGMIDRAGDVEDLQKALGRASADGLAVVRALAQDSRLVSKELVVIDEDEQPVSTDVTASPDFLEPFIRGARRRRSGWRVRTHDELLDRLYGIFKVLRENSQELGDDAGYQRGMGEARRRATKLRRLMFRLSDTVKRRPSWPLSDVVNGELDESESRIVILLVGKEMGFHSDDDKLFTGEGIARAVSRTLPGVRHKLRLLARDETLRTGAYVQVCGGEGDSTAVEDDATLRACEFELTPQFRDHLKISRQRRSKNKAREPKVKMSQLVLPADVRKALDMALAQVRHSKVLLEDWGLGEAVPYGRGVTVLFSGPPGTGKTASAEALAHELERGIIVASYAEIQNCWVGQTEKNIVRIFRQAADDGAVLFWDEADAMFYDRDSASRNWEVRDVNVLLQELERFGGLCILATNRKITLDKALERRIAVKVEFTPPDREMRRQIWRRLVPKKLPLSEGVDLDDLARRELTGGEIKNVVLNAARIALARDPEGNVAAADFEQAMSMEKSGGWTSQKRMGFTVR